MILHLLASTLCQYVVVCVCYSAFVIWLNYKNKQKQCVIELLCHLVNTFKTNLLFKPSS